MSKRRRGDNRSASHGTALIGWVIAAVIVIGAIAFAWYHNRDPHEPAPRPPQLPLPAPTPDPTPDPTPTPPAPVPTPVPTQPAPFSPPPLAWNGSPNLFLGNPSNAGADRNNFLLQHAGYTLSYNDSRGGPNWVSWRLRREDTGNASRARFFSPDPLLPAGFTVVSHADYTGSGFDRGHLCPHSDRDGMRASSDETFLMTNILPQSPTLNQKPWKFLEDYSRELVREGAATVFTIAGGIGDGGAGSKGPAARIAKDKVAVPAQCWKLIVIVPSSQAARPDAVTAAGTRVIAVLMPNEESVGQRWQAYQLTVEDLERHTGHRFLTTLRPEVANELRRRGK